MNLNIYKEMINKLDKFYSLTGEQQFILVVWAQCLEHQSWNVISNYTTPEYSNSIKLRRLIKRNGKFFQENLGINTASLKPTTKNLFAASYINGFSEGYSIGFDNCWTTKAKNDK